MKTQLHFIGLVDFEAGYHLESPEQELVPVDKVGRRRGVRLPRQEDLLAVVRGFLDGVGEAHG
jgi:hypothetical protein